MPSFALNHMTAPRLGWEAFLDLTQSLNCVGVEFRNDLKGQLFDGAKASFPTKPPCSAPLTSMT